MNRILIYIQFIFICSCATPLVVATQDAACDRVNERVQDTEKRDCDNIDEIISAVATDITLAKEIGGHAKREYFTSEPKYSPVHEGPDSNLCKAGQSKVCSASKGCICTE